ncbi:MAG: hypothetical protein MUF13_00120 [Akkermansiaceae bacterium]|jgi:hypothetical protein|nr:hypothetical protein [Akkermansiaceae bacterium]
MKFPLVLTALIIAAGSFWGMKETQTLAKLREQHRQVIQEAATLGISSDVTQPFNPTKSTKRQRDDGERKAKDFANSLVAFAKEMKELEKNGTQPDADMQKRIFDMVEGMYSLKGSELKIVIADLRSRSDLDDETRKEMISFSIMMLAQQHPQTALAIFTESADLLDGNPMSKHVLSSSLSQWAKDQPLEALEWIKQNAEKHPELVTEETKRAVITGAAENDLGLAFQLSTELKLTAAEDSILRSLARSAKTPERRADFLAALRKQAASMPDKEAAAKLMDSGIGTLFSTVADGGFDKTMEWMKTSGLNADETATLMKETDSLSYHITKADTGKWLDWISSNAGQAGEADKPENATRNLVRNWTENDYKAAGEWLASSPAGPHKETATIAYLETVAPYDPDVAAQWADTLTGDKKTAAIRKIHQALKNKNLEAAEDFATKHGLSKE